MLPSDIHLVKILSDRTYPNHPEEGDIFVEKQRLFPQGCFTLENDKRIAGYCMSHPWIAGCPPRLNTRLSAIPDSPTTLFLHDVVVVEELRDQGMAGALLLLLYDVALLHKLTSVTLVSVNGSERFWYKRGFIAISDRTLQAYAKSAYGDEALMMRLSVSASPK